MVLDLRRALLGEEEIEVGRALLVEEDIEARREDFGVRSGKISESHCKNCLVPEIGPSLV